MALVPSPEAQALVTSHFSPNVSQTGEENGSIPLEACQQGSWVLCILTPNLASTYTQAQTSPNACG